MSRDQLTDAQAMVLQYISDELGEGRPSPTYREIAKRFGFESPRSAQNHVNALKKKRALVSSAGKARSLRPTAPLPAKKVRVIPLAGAIPAGRAVERAQENEEFLALDFSAVGYTPSSNAFALRVEGDSMIDKHICDGDIAVIEGNTHPSSGQIVAALVDGGCTLKTLIAKQGRAFLRAENPRYQDIVPVEEMRIQGVVRAIIRKL